MELFAADGHDAGGCERVTGKSGMRPITTELGVFVVPGWTGDMAAGVEWSGPTGIMTAWRRSLITVTAAGLATLKVGALTQIARLERCQRRLGAAAGVVKPTQRERERWEPVDAGEVDAQTRPRELIERIPHIQRYRLTAEGLCHRPGRHRTQARVLSPVLSATLDGESATRLQAAIATYDREVGPPLGRTRTGRVTTRTEWPADRPIPNLTQL